MFQRGFVFLIMMWLVATGPGQAQTARDLAERHPAAQTVVQYLRLLLMRDFEKAAALVHSESIEGMKADYLRRVKTPTLPLDEVLAMCRSLGVDDETGIERMTPKEFYVAYNEGMQKRYNVTEEVNKRIADSLDLNLLAAADERPDLVHFLVRTKHKTMRNFVQNLEVISLVKRNGQWLVSLGEHLTKVTPLEQMASKPGAKPAVPPKSIDAKPEAPPADQKPQ
jgi:hypothetical protein